jgi:diaminohydroxyphosphoribosylaminopyrimidine deaminase/5-amino-6-(5-phosphoribosylamino)uracil reductase
MQFGSDAEAMQHALMLARRGFGRVEPNPQVGAVLTTAEGRLIADGFHQACGGPHAEVHALRAAGEQARGATLYVTLEP